MVGVFTNQLTHKNLRKLETSLKTNLFWDYFNRFGNTLVSLITSTILARLLNPADYGLVGISMAVNGLAGIFLNLGFVSAIIQAKELDNKSLSTAFFLNIGIAFFMYGIIFFSAFTISEFYQLPELENILKITALSFIINALNIIPSALMTRGMKFKQMAIVSLISSFVSGSLGIYLAMHRHGVWSIVFQQLLGALLILLGYYFSTKWLPIFYFKLQSIKNMLQFGMYMFFSGLLEGIYSRIDIFLIAKVFSPASLGLYTRAQSLDGMIRTLSSGSLLNVLFPTFAKIREDKEQLKKLYYQYFQLISFLFCLLAGIFYLGAEQLFLILFGAQWHVSAVYFKILVLAGFAYPLSSLSLSIIEARGNSKSFFVVEIIKKLLFLPTYFIAYFYGIIPFLISFVIACFIGTFINVRFLKFELAISVWQTIKFLSSYLIVAFGIIAFIHFIHFQLNYPNSMYMVFIEIIAFISAYLLINFFTKSKGIEYSFELINKKL
jgi:O-antigen/teichoic acid export membrane protein